MRRPKDLWTIARAFFTFHRFDLKLRRQPFQKLYERAVERETDEDGKARPGTASPAEISHMIDVLQRAAQLIRRFDLRTRPDCLPRSFMFHHLLREAGVPARLRLGVKTAPFAAHAWVEVHGETVSDYGHESRHYQGLGGSEERQVAA